MKFPSWVIRRRIILRRQREEAWRIAETKCLLLGAEFFYSAMDDCFVGKAYHPFIEMPVYVYAATKGEAAEKLLFCFVPKDLESQKEKTT